MNFKNLFRENAKLIKLVFFEFFVQLFAGFLYQQFRSALLKAMGGRKKDECFFFQKKDFSSRYQNLSRKPNLAEKFFFRNE